MKRKMLAVFGVAMVLGTTAASAMIATSSDDTGAFKLGCRKTFSCVQ